jgi:molybdopterin molybdotransferase
MLNPDQALAVLLDAVPRARPRRMRLESALGLGLAGPLTARGDLPRCDVSAVDGFAVRGPALPAGASLPLGAAMAAGRPRGRLRPGTASPIYTGAPVPQGADRVIPLELARAEAGAVAFEHWPAQGANIRRRGEELKRGSLGLPAGAVLTPEALGFAASLGQDQAWVHPRPRVAVLVTGDEIRPAGARLASGQIWDANGPLLRAWLGQRGVVPKRLQVGDQADAVEAAVALGLEDCDLLICSGGASVGDRDFVRPALAEAGVRTLFWKVAQKPGKPLYAGKRGRSLVLGLPGNPAAVALCLRAYVQPLLDRMQGRPGAEPQWALTGQALPGDGAKTVFLKGRLLNKGGTLRAVPLGAQGSHMLSSLALSGAWLAVPPKGVKKNAALRVLAL